MRSLSPRVGRSRVHMGTNLDYRTRRKERDQCTMKLELRDTEFIFQYEVLMEIFELEVDRGGTTEDVLWGIHSGTAYIHVWRKKSQLWTEKLL